MERAAPAEPAADAAVVAAVVAAEVAVSAVWRHRRAPLELYAHLLSTQSTRIA